MMSHHRGTIGIMTLLVASMASILPLLNEGQGLPAVDFSTVTIRFRGDTLQVFYDCLCGDYVKDCTMHYDGIFVRDIVGPSEPDMSPIPREVTFICDRPFTFVGGSRRYSCRLREADDTSDCGCAAACPVSHISETHSSMCRDKCVNIMWNSCHVEYEDFVNSDAPIRNSCPRPTPPNLPPLATQETSGILSTTNESPSTTHESPSSTNESPSSTNGYASSTNEIHETATIGDHDSEGTNDTQTLIIAVGASGGTFLILVVSVIIAVCCWHSKKRETNQTKEYKPDPENRHYITNDDLVLETPYHSPIQGYNNIDNNDYKYSGRYENEWEINIDTSMYSEAIDNTTEASKDNSNVKLSKINNVITHCRDSVYHGSYEDVDLDELSPHLHKPESEPTGQICLKQNFNKKNGGHVNINMLKVNCKKPDQNKNMDEIVLSTDNFASQPLPGWNAIDKKHKQSLENNADDTYAKVVKIKKSKRGDLANCKPESQSFSADKDVLTNTYAKLGQREEIDDEDLATYNHESQTFSKLQNGKNELKDKDRFTDTYARLGQREDIDDGDLATYNHESQTFCYLQNGKNEGNELTDKYINLDHTEVVDDGDLGTFNKDSQTFC